VLSDPRFLNAVFSAIEAAARVGRGEKRAALRNAVLNSVRPGSPAADLQQVFIRYVDELQPSHLRLLKLIAEGVAQQGPNVYASTENTRRLHQVLQERDPELLSSGLLGLCCEDLASRGLIRRSSGNRDGWAQLTMLQMSADGFGQMFLKFISEPAQ
ncbi:MAG TPA: hypothetical protein VKE50_07185, partial [Thermoanaerobaculia bacterium]|nr:hypothetical protein [Thermoanaerobaculia bacterium]